MQLKRPTVSSRLSSCAEAACRRLSAECVLFGSALSLQILRPSRSFLPPACCVFFCVCVFLFAAEGPASPTSPRATSRGAAERGEKTPEGHLLCVQAVRAEVDSGGALNPNQRGPQTGYTKTNTDRGRGVNKRCGTEQMLYRQEHKKQCWKLSLWRSVESKSQVQALHKIPHYTIIEETAYGNYAAHT